MVTGYLPTSGLKPQGKLPSAIVPGVHYSCVVTHNSFLLRPACCLFTTAPPLLSAQMWDTSPSFQWEHRLHSREVQALQVSGLEKTH